MTLYIGNQPVTGISIGGQPVSKVWIGDQLYYQTGVDINLTNGDFTEVIAGNKGWVAEDGNYVNWNTTNVQVSTDDTGTVTDAYGTITNTGVTTEAGTNYTFRAFLQDRFGNGFPGIKLTVEDAQGTLVSQQFTTLGWCEVSFNAREVLTDVSVEAYTFVYQFVEMTVSEVQFIKN